MNPGAAEKLIGGWVAGTLTAEERALLIEASLSNQALFNALADEEGLRELLADPAARRELIAVLAAKPAKQRESQWRWLFKPAPMAAFSAGALAVLAFVVVRGPMVEQRVAPVVMDAVAPAVAAGPKPSEPMATVIREERAAKDYRAATAKKEQPVPLQQPPAAPTVAIAADKLNKAADAVPAAASPLGRLRDAEAAGPPALAAAPPPPPPPAAQAEAVRVDVAPEQLDEGKAKRAAASTAPPPAAKAAAPPPFRHRVERHQPDGQWVEFGGELGVGAEARLAIEANQVGVVMVRSAGETVSLPVAPGQTVYFPASGSLASTAGEREVALLFRPGLAAQVQQQTASQSYRTLSGGQRQQQQQAQSPVAGEYAVTVRLRYR